ncbi:hypothetical protein IFM89_032947 [Coptis chinensis]|uniref:STAS domain-containing protein n=1 Tax=Coptis chinensis TaxID=261450 RepID=A0A835I8A7_9MAGN|nr:hypothetical protein IFM89_032947 [Coptis chinensis]
MAHPSGENLERKEVDIRSMSSSHRHADQAAFIHKVGLPAKQNLFKEFKSQVKETFFSDDPLRPFKHQPGSRKFILGLQTLFPILEWGRDYNLSKFKGDLIAGLTIASLCIPQDIGYAKLANLPPQYGLYSSFVPPLIYAFMGSSRDIAIGPVAVVSLLLGTLLQNEIDFEKYPLEYRRLAFTATFFAGITEAALGFLRLGFLIDFLSHAAVVGFMGGAAITIALQQLKGFLGIKKFTKKTDIISVMQSIFHSAHHGGKKSRRLFWVPAIAPLISVIVSTFFVYITRADKQGVAIVKHIEKGINPPSVKEIYFSGEYALKGFRIGVVAGMIALTEAVAIGRTFAAKKDYTLDGNKEMVALGAMNVIGSMTSCYVATGSFSRSAVNYMAGCQTAVSNIVMSCIVILTLELITPLFKYTPNAILASIIITAVIGLIDYDAVILIWKIDKFDFVACMGAFFGVIFASVEVGLLIAVRSVASNSKHIYLLKPFPCRILRWLTDEDEQLKAKDLPRIDVLILEMSPVTDIDTSGIHALEELYRSLKKREVEILLANPGQAVIDKLHSSKFADLIGADKIFLRVADAVLTCRPKVVDDV